MQSVANTDQARAWNGYEGQHWAEHQASWDDVSSEINDPLLTAAAVGRSDRVLDVGCGNGQSTRLAARRAPHGQAVGLDLSGPMLGRARAAAAEEGLHNVRFDQGDAQVYPFPAGEFDVVISRGGVMFFNDPVAAFTNIGRAVRPGGRAAFAVFQHMACQQWFTVLMSAILGRTLRPSTADAEGPGMFSLADPDHTTDVLTRAGFAKIHLESVDTLMNYGPDAERAAAFVLSSGPVRHLLQQHSPDRYAQALDDVTEALRPHQTPGGVLLRGRHWLITASSSRG